MSNFFETVEKLRELHDFLVGFSKESPEMYSQFFDTLPVPDAANQVSNARPEDSSSLTNVDRMAAYLEQHPWISVSELAEGTGIKRSIVNALLYAKSSRGRFTAKDAPENPKLRLWAASSDEVVCRVGNKEFVKPPKRLSTTDLVLQWLKENGQGSVSDIAKGIGHLAQTKSPDLRSVVRTIVCRAVDDGTVAVMKCGHANIYAMVESENAQNFVKDASPDDTTLDLVTKCFNENGNQFLTVNDLIQRTGRTQSAIRDVIYSKHQDRFEKLSRQGPGNQSIFRLQGAD